MLHIGSKAIGCGGINHIFSVGILTTSPPPEGIRDGGVNSGEDMRQENRQMKRQMNRQTDRQTDKTYLPAAGMSKNKNEKVSLN